MAGFAALGALALGLWAFHFLYSLEMGTKSALEQIIQFLGQSRQ